MIHKYLYVHRLSRAAAAYLIWGVVVGMPNSSRRCSRAYPKVRSQQRARNKVTLERVAGLPIVPIM